MKTVIKNAKLSTGDIVDILIKDDIIENICLPGKINTRKLNIIDAKNNYVLAGMIDMHTHMRDLNQSHKETFYSGSVACYKNGITLFCDMPNSKPTTTSMKNLNLKLMFMKQSLVEAKCYIGLDNNSTYKEVKQMLKYAIGIKIFLNETTGSMNFDLTKLDKKIFNLDTLYLFHAENDDILKIKDLFSNNNTRIHICHVSSKKEYENVLLLKQIFNNLTYEFAPHHLILNDSIFKNQKLNKVKPSLKSKDDQEFILSKFIEDDSAIYATDHAPHLLREKLESTCYGYPGIDTALYILLKMFNKQMISMQKIEQCYSTNPANALGLIKYGKIKKGYKANLIIIDPTYKFNLKNDRIYSKCNWSPFINTNLYGRVIKTIINGKVIGDEYEQKK